MFCETIPHCNPAVWLAFLEAPNPSSWRAQCSAGVFKGSTSYAAAAMMIEEEIPFLFRDDEALQWMLSWP